MNLYVICGPESSGNRLLAAAFVRAGCYGEGSTRQPKRAYEIQRPGPAVIIDHRMRLVPEALELGWRPHLIVVVREPIAQAKSAVAHGHFDDVAEAMRNREIAFHRNVRFARHHSLPLHILPYEGLTEAFFKAWLPTLGLSGKVDRKLELFGQDAPARPVNQNGKHYV